MRLLRGHLDRLTVAGYGIVREEIAIGYAQSGTSGAVRADLCALGLRKANEVFQDVGDQHFAARVLRNRCRRKEAEQIAGFLRSFGPCCGGRRDQLLFQLLLPIPQGFLVCLHLRHQAAEVGCLLRCHASMVIEADGSIRHGRLHETGFVRCAGACSRPVLGPREVLAEGSRRTSGYPVRS